MAFAVDGRIRRGIPANYRTEVKEYLVAKKQQTGAPVYFYPGELISEIGRRWKAESNDRKQTLWNQMVKVDQAAGTRQRKKSKNPRKPRKKPTFKRPNKNGCPPPGYICAKKRCYPTFTEADFVKCTNNPNQAGIWAEVKRIQDSGHPVTRSFFADMKNPCGLEAWKAKTCGRK